MNRSLIRAAGRRPAPVTQLMQTLYSAVILSYCGRHHARRRVIVHRTHSAQEKFWYNQAWFNVLRGTRINEVLCRRYKVMPVTGEFKKKLSEETTPALAGPPVRPNPHPGWFDTSGWEGWEGGKW